MLTFEEWKDIYAHEVFELRYNESLSTLIDSAFGDDSNNWTNIKESYNCYVEWHNSKYTKLGQALK